MGHGGSRVVERIVEKPVIKDNPALANQVTACNKQIESLTLQLKGFVVSDLEKTKAIMAYGEKMNGLHEQMSRLDETNRERAAQIQQLMETIQNLKADKANMYAQYVAQKKKEIAEQGAIGKVAFEDIIGLDSVKDLVNAQIHNKTTEGLIAFGPPGCGKTYISKAIAFEGNFNYVIIQPSNIVGDTDEHSLAFLQTAFEEGRKKTPCILFFDELDALFGEDETSARARLLIGELNTQLDGLQTNNKGIMFVASTNRPWNLSPAIRRRFESKLYFPLPDERLRYRYFQRQFTINFIPHRCTDADMHSFAQATQRHSFSELHDVAKFVAIRQSSILRKCTHVRLSAEEGMPAPVHIPCEAGAAGAVSVQQPDIQALMAQRKVAVPVTREIVEYAMSRVRPQTCAADITRFEEFSRDFGVNVMDDSELLF